MLNRTIKPFIWITFIGLTCSNVLSCSSQQKPESPTISIGFVSIDGGEFYLGNQTDSGRANEYPAILTMVEGFEISKFEITNEQFCVFLNSRGNEDEDGNYWLDIESPYCNIVLKEGTYFPKTGKENHPVIEVSWRAATAFAKWVSARLPTEAEWEFAASNRGKYLRFSTGDSLSNNLANIKGIGGRDQWSGTSPVGSFPPNELGIYDLTGNIWEWCSDPLRLHNSTALFDPVDDTLGTTRVVKGGSWSFPPKFQTITYRAREYEVYYSYDNGFRVAR